MPYPSHIARNALRSALRNHRDSALVLSGRLVNSLSLADLKAALAAIGCDPDKIAAAALGSASAAGARAYEQSRASRTFCARCDSASVDGCTDLGCPHTPKRPRTSKRIDVHDWHQAASTADIMERVEHLRQLHQPGPVDLGDTDNACDQDSLFAELAELETELDKRSTLTPEPEPEVAVIDPVETEVQTIRSLIVTGGFSTCQRH